MELTEYEQRMKCYLLKDLKWLFRIYRKVTIEQWDNIRDEAYMAAMLHGGYIKLIFDCCDYNLRIISFSEEVTLRRNGMDVLNYKSINKSEVSYEINIIDEDTKYLTTLTDKKEISFIKEKIAIRLTDSLHEQISLKSDSIIMFPEKYMEQEYRNECNKKFKQYFDDNKISESI